MQKRFLRMKRLERVLPSAAEELERLEGDGGHEAIARS